MSSDPTPRNPAPSSVFYPPPSSSHQHPPLPPIPHQHPPLPSIPHHYPPSMSDSTIPSFSRASTVPSASYTLPTLQDQPQHLSHPQNVNSLSLSMPHTSSVPHPPPFPSPLGHQPSRARPNRPPASRVLQQPEFSLPLLARINSAEEKLRSSPFFQELLADVVRRTPGIITADVEGRLIVPGRKRNKDLIVQYGFPKTDEDVEYCLEDTPGLSQTNFMALKTSLVDNLAQVRQATCEAVVDLENSIAQQVSFRIVPSTELDKRLAYTVGRFCKARKQVMHKYRGYVRNRRWIENIATRQRRGCLTHRQNNILRLWLFTNFSNPYPDTQDKKNLISRTHLSMIQINNWLINARSRVWKPTVEIMSGERIRKEMSNKEDRYRDTRLDNRTDYDSEYFGMMPQHIVPNGHVQHPDVVQGQLMHPSQSPVISNAGGPQQHSGQVDGIAEDGTWLGSQNWTSLDFPADVHLNN